jgi:hypothetical protein
MRASVLPPHKHGILESYRINHAECVREVRRDPALIKIFAQLYGTDQLTCSMDRVNFRFPGRCYESKGPWCHVDQTLEQGDVRLYVQAYLTLSDSLDQEKSPGNRFYEGSHAIFEEFFEDSKTGNNDGWILLTDEQRSALRKRCPLVKPTYRRGSLVLWDSRTVHSPFDGTDFSQGRFCVYLNYCPLWEKQRDEILLEKKRLAFTEHRATTHKPCPQKMFAKTARTYGRENVALLEIDPALLGNKAEPTPVEQYLFGFKKYKGQEGCLLGETWRQEAKGRKPLLKFVSPFVAAKTVKQQQQKKRKPIQASEQKPKKQKAQ